MRPGLRSLLRDPGALCFPLVVWGLASAWVLGFDSPVSLSFLLPWAIGLIPLAVIGLGLAAAMWMVSAGGLLLIAGPFLFGYAEQGGSAAILSAVITGVLLTLAAVASARQSRD